MAAELNSLFLSIAFLYLHFILAVIFGPSRSRFLCSQKNRDDRKTEKDKEVCDFVVLLGVLNCLAEVARSDIMMHPSSTDSFVTHCSDVCLQSTVEAIFTHCSAN